MSREMHILRAQRITTGPQIRGTHPIVVSFENYRDKVRHVHNARRCLLYYMLEK